LIDKQHKSSNDSFFMVVVLFFNDVQK